MAERDDDDGENSEVDCEDERDVLEYYFRKGYTYDEMLRFLSDFHGIDMSLSTLQRRLNEHDLRRRQVNYDMAALRSRIQAELDGPGCMAGYRSLWHTLRMEGIQVPRIIVQQLLAEMDPAGRDLRMAHRLTRRQYHNPGPNHAWHCDGYDKLKPYGFPVHGCIDGWSRKVLWLKITRSNNSPDVIASFYLECVRHHNGCPVRLITDKGTENGTAATIQCFFRDSLEAHKYVTSTHNQRIEAWWAYLRKSRSNWWINFFKDLIEQDILNTADELHMECLWFWFSALLQSDLDNVKEHWNTHHIRPSRHASVSGRPNSLFSFPEIQGGQNNLLLEVPEYKFNYAANELVEVDHSNTYQEYFEHLILNSELEHGEDWRSALNLYRELLRIAANGRD